MFLSLRRRMWNHLKEVSSHKVQQIDDRVNDPEAYELGKLLRLMDKFYARMEKRVQKGKALTAEDKMRTFSILAPTTMALEIAEQKNIHIETATRVSERMDRITELLGGTTSTSDLQEIQSKIMEEIKKQQVEAAALEK